MKNYTATYSVGIDLGTTHTVVAYSDIGDPAKAIHLFEISQLIAPGEVSAKPLLPSVRYHPAPGEITEEAGFLTQEKGAVLGEAARLLGAKSQGRLVTSAKSWLSHTSVDHSAAILPWGSDESVFKISPLEASASYLRHVCAVWEHRFPKAPLALQEVVITVPASFDESARSLTLEAAKMAGLSGVRLLEEPQAVCYDWLRRHAGTIKSSLADRRLLLVCDVGGGTTDLTLIKIEQGVDEPKLTRIGVGDHLMLGGDNIDLALAHLAESRLRTGDKKLSTADLSQLLEQCRIAKEQLLADDAPEQVAITLLGGGSRLIGGTKSTSLSKEEVKQIALDGFLPMSGLQDLPDRKRSGVVEFGLPYAAEPAISKHIAAFLQMHAQAAQMAFSGTGTEHQIVPDALLLNGGVFRSPAMVQRLIDLLAGWRGGHPPLLLDNSHPELAVAYGAVSYAVARRDKKLKIGGGAARSYFLLVDAAAKSGDGKPGGHGVCILPKGSEEGHEILLSDRQFALRVGQPVRFHLLSSSGDGTYQPGAIVELDDERFHSLPPLAVAFEGQLKTEVAVQLLATYTEVGTLQLQCVAVADSNQRWDVEFQIRKKAQTAVNAELPSQLPQALEKVQAVFGAKSKQVDPQAVKTLRADLENVLAAPRGAWQTPLLRELFTALLEGSKYRRRSEQHERLWLSLAGFCLRPGFGYPLDDWRVEQLWKLYSEGLQFVNEKQNWAEWWTLWRRVAGGLNADAQQRIFNDIAKFINPAAARQPGVGKQLATRGYEDMVRLAAALERLNLVDKIQLGNWLLKRLEKAGEPEQSWWAVGRIGGRILFHGNNHQVIPAETAEIWLKQLLKADWKKLTQAAFAATLLARRCDDRARDIDDSLRAQVIDKLKQAKSPVSWVDMVAEFKQLDEQQEKQVFGEALPPGLKLIV
ncbi:molecular chaperone DnaK [Methylomonas sp. LW13]|uniref:Hsp70 family protein n=1 Tax=unclassified Methylomonas TaxID=2608980 RepID=UPI00051BA880|nr:MULTISPECIES: Hsp70 family protein [unclassified Methylomonas]PKD41786.1 molecular chaperone DnaK [Methylomonas sp. Kb3]QBC26234.1 molecular chaperone DnaK [Methylomonas sp. LW13]